MALPDGTFDVDWLEEARAARERLAPFLVPTPLLRSRLLSERLERDVFLKLETRHPTGAYKVRPALNGILSHLEEARSRGVLTTSSGNFAQAVAWAARTLGVKATIVMTSDTAPYKVERTRAFGAEVLFCGTTFESRFETVAKLEAERGSVVLHPFDSPETIAGDGTLALELLEQLPGPFTVGVPASGGGLISGVAAVLKSPLLEEASRGATVVGFQPEAGGAVFRSLEAGTRVNVGKVHTIADALVASIPGVRTFELIRSFCEGFRLVGERELAQAMLWLLEEEKLWVEPGGAAAVAGALFGREALPGGRGPLVLVLTGGNLDPRRLGEITALL